MREAKGNLVEFDSWHKLLDALETEFTVSFKDVCKIMRASRPWVNQYIRPYVPAVFINSSRRGDGSSGRTDWVRVASIQLDRPEMRESIWFHREDFKKFIEFSVHSCTKQTKKIPMTFLIPKDQIEAFVAERKEARAAIKQAAKDGAPPVVIARLAHQLNEIPRKFFSSDPAIQKLLASEMHVTERTKAPAVPVKLPKNYIEHWQAPHDLKGYGDADETIYRDIFRRGDIRIELLLQDENGKLGTKIFYVHDPEPVHADYENEGSIIVTEQAWQDFLREKNG